MMKSKAHTITAQLKIQVRDPIDVRMKGYIFHFTNFCLFQWTFQGLAPIPPIATSFQFSKGLWLVVEGFRERHEQCKVVFDFD